VAPTTEMDLTRAVGQASCAPAAFPELRKVSLAQ
jgi:hypothetical protein